MTINLTKKMSKEEREIISGMKMALAALKGKNPKGLVTVWEAATKKEAKKARSLVHASQAEFARLLRVNPKTVQAWEQGVKPPSGPATSWIRLILNKPTEGRKALLASH